MEGQRTVSDIETEWTVLAGKALHASGFWLEFHGNPRSNQFSVTHHVAGAALKPLEVVRLIRLGTELYREHTAPLQDKESTRSTEGTPTRQHQLSP
ncbi:hypothetical protein J2T57_000762 [Natronocella acetinitrilica]|uniref:Uncharacterized protein n=1 Tax=Natronocella acetinitrilica TaxID=414046 RepID=A0AAE3G3E3_9GAMM|nr:hypothetical protein [Natronocella acetinitrilica]